MFTSIHSPRLRQINITGTILSVLFGLPILAIMWNFSLMETFSPVGEKWCSVSVSPDNAQAMSDHRLDNAYFEIPPSVGYTEGTFVMRRKMHVIPLGPWSFKDCPLGSHPIN